MMNRAPATATPPAASSANTASLDRAIAREEMSGLTFVLAGRLVVLSLLAVWAVSTLPFERSGLYLAAIIAFAALSTAPYVLLRHGVGGHVLACAFLLLDAAVLSYVLIVPAPYGIDGWTQQLNLRLPGFLYLAVFVVGMALSYKPALVLWAGIAAAVTWSAGSLWVAGLPDTIAFTSLDILDAGLGKEAVVSTFLAPNAVSLTRLYNQLVFLVLITLILTLVVWRSRRLVQRQVAAETQRAALSRYFSPNILRELTDNRSLDRPAVQRVAVLFADMVGFTSVSERLAPTELVTLLREFHGRLARTVLAHDGTVDKYIGDAVMVHFGTPRVRADDPVRALVCAAEMLAEIQRWNAERTANGEAPIDIGIGVHIGDVIVGNIGDARRLEYTVLGDTVNVANRLERLTRDIGTPLIVSDALIEAVRATGTDPLDILPDLCRDTSRTVRGRQEPVPIWRAGAFEAAASPH